MPPHTTHRHAPPPPPRTTATTHHAPRTTPATTRYTCTYTFVNEEDHPLESTFFFPKQPHAAVAGLAVDITDADGATSRTVRGVVQEKEAAKATYDSESGSKVDAASASTNHPKHIILHRSRHTTPDTPHSTNHRRHHPPPPTAAPYQPRRTKARRRCS